MRYVQVFVTVFFVTLLATACPTTDSDAPEEAASESARETKSADESEEGPVIEEIADPGTDGRGSEPDGVGKRDRSRSKSSEGGQKAEPLMDH